MKIGSLFGTAGAILAAGIAAVVAISGAAGPAMAAQGIDAGRGGERLDTLIDRGIRANGPFFTPEERAVIERACGYAPGSWDGFEANMTDNVFICTNGRRVDSAEVRAAMREAGPRIGARVSRVMASTEVRQAIAEVTREAAAQALRGIDQAAITQRAAAQARAAASEAMRDVDHAAIVREAQAAAAEAIEEARRAIAEAERERAARRR